MWEKFLPKFERPWNVLELRCLVVISLLLQVFLIATGNRRKYTRNKWLAIGIWLSYLCADTVATLSLGVLSMADRKDDPGRYTIMAFWAPFLLMHLGGPDTITAYSLADNELWSRHLLGLVAQVGVAIYVFNRSWSGTVINYLWMVVFVGGMIKYGERSWVLFSASRDRIRDLLVSEPDAGPNYPNLMDEFVSKKQEGYEVSLREVFISLDDAANTKDTGEENQLEDAQILSTAYYLFQTFRKLFADLILSFGDKQNSLKIFTADKMTWDKAFRIVEIELGLVYDLFYTKAFLLYSRHGLCLRLLSYSSTIAAFVTFLIINKNVYPKTEVIITYILLGGAISIEMYAIMMLLSLDRTMIWLSEDWGTLPKLIRKFRKPIAWIVTKILLPLRCLHIVPAAKRWSDAMGQYNFLDYWVEDKTKSPKLRKLYLFMEKLRLNLEKYFLKNGVSTPDGLKALIFEKLRERRESNDEKKSGSYRYDKIVLKEMNCFDKIDEIEFHQSVLLWHLATDFCYYTDRSVSINERWLSVFVMNEKSSPEDNLKFKRETSRLLSNYMMHLLILFPFMLPRGIGQIRFKDTLAEATDFFEGEQKLSRKKACEMLLLVHTELEPSKVKGDRSKSLLFDACRLAKSLNEEDEKWDKIIRAWLDILTFAAGKCKWNNHAEKLSQGGDLLTHVWLLMAHFGMTRQFQISQGYARAKLDLK